MLVQQLLLMLSATETGTTAVAELETAPEIVTMATPVPGAVALEDVLEAHIAVLIVPIETAAIIADCVTSSRSVIFQQLSVV